MMFNTLPVSASRLRNRTLQQGRRRFRRLSFFPFFEQSGKVRRIMYVAPDSPEIYAIPTHVPFPRPTLLGRVAVPENVALFTPIRRADLAELARFWHFDPWWVLDEPRFAVHWARKQLKLTNCVKRAKSKLAAVYYRRDLSQLQWVLYHEDGGSLSVSGWNELQLPLRPALLGVHDRTKVSTRWVLDPVWEKR